MLRRTVPERATESAGLQDVEDRKETRMETLAGLVRYAALQAVDTLVQVEYGQWLEAGSQITECHHDWLEELVRDEGGKFKVVRGRSYELSVEPKSLRCQVHGDSWCGTSPQGLHHRAAPSCGVRAPRVDGL